MSSAASVQVAFGHGDSSSIYVRSYGTSHDGNDGKKNSLDLNGSDDDGRICLTLPSKEDRERDLKDSDDGKICLSLPSKLEECSNDATSNLVVKKKYREPWVRSMLSLSLSLSTLHRHTFSIWLLC